MSIKTTIHCDQCDKRVDYLDVDLDHHEEGFQLCPEAQEEIEFRNSFAHSCGTTHHPIDPLVLPKNICSRGCMMEYFNTWLNNLPLQQKNSE